MKFKFKKIIFKTPIVCSDMQLVITSLNRAVLYRDIFIFR